MIDLKVTNPHEMKIAVTATFTIGQWREISRQIQQNRTHFYSPLIDFLQGIETGIELIEKRITIRTPESKL